MIREGYWLPEMSTQRIQPRSLHRLGLVALAAGLLVALSACGGGAPSGQSGAPGASGSSGAAPQGGAAHGGGDEVVKIGVVLPTSGREAKPGTYQWEGIQLAIKQINDQGGVSVGGKKLKIEPVFYDDESDQAKSASLVERTMTADKVVAVIGGYSTALGQAESVMPDRY